MEMDCIVKNIVYPLILTKNIAGKSRYILLYSIRLQFMIIMQKVTS